jgi:ABC-type thiamin/hydroxymethylpyrimidine transport system permease subunit
MNDVRVKTPYFTTFQLILLALFAALIVAAKIALKTPIESPGHTGVFWLAIMVTAAGVVPKRGSASLVGLTSGILASFLGVGDFGALNTLLSYTMVGMGVDLVLWITASSPENWLVAMLAGIVGHLGKFLVKWLFGLLTGAPLGFIALGLIWSLGGYIIFGAVGGLLGALTLRALHKAGFFAYIAEKK